MLDKLGLRDARLTIYAIVYSFSQYGETEYYGGRKYMAEASGRSLPTVDRVLNELEKDGLIKKCDRVNDGVSHCRYSVYLDENGEGIINPQKEENDDDTPYHDDNTPYHHNNTTPYHHDKSSLYNKDNNKDNKEINKENNKEKDTLDSVSKKLSHKYNKDVPLTDKEIEFYVGMEKTYPHVMRMDAPLLYSQYKKLLTEYKPVKIKANLEAMENYKPLKNRRDAYRTLRNWLELDKREYQNV